MNPPPYIRGLQMIPWYLPFNVMTPEACTRGSTTDALHRFHCASPASTMRYEEGWQRETNSYTNLCVVARGTPHGRFFSPCPNKSGGSREIATVRHSRSPGWVVGWHCRMPPAPPNLPRIGAAREPPRRALHQGGRLWCGLHEHTGRDGLDCGDAGDVAAFLRRGPKTTTSLIVASLSWTGYFETPLGT